MDKTDPKNQLEPRVNGLYNRFRSLAGRFGYTFRRPVVTVGGTPNVLFLGNHSSGKSSFINHLLEGTAVQDTGVAPTDDGFTVILYGETESDANGPAALDCLPAEFSGLRDLGSSFLQHLRVKFRNRAILRRVSFIDSPGMIGTADGPHVRGYDFLAAVRAFSEIADLVLFLFDPDKPGTTGETVHALGSSFSGLEFKLRILMNKCDLFDSMFDFARAYGSLCWNLAHVLPGKDLPTVFTTFVPQPRLDRTASRVSLADFDRHRGDILDQILHSDERRTDNLVSSVLRDLDGLAMQARTLVTARRSVRLLQGTGAVAATLATLVGAVGGWLALHRWLLPPAPDARFWHARPLAAAAAGLVLAVLLGSAVWGIARLVIRRRKARVLRNPDIVFEETYLEALSTGDRDDLRQTWNTVKTDFLRQFALRDSAFHPFAEARLRRLARARDSFSAKP
jgi:hypothetical protein